MSDTPTNEGNGCRHEASPLEVAIYTELGERLRASWEQRKHSDESMTNKHTAILVALVGVAVTADANHLIDQELIWPAIMVVNIVGLIMSFWWWLEKKLELEKAKYTAISMENMEDSFSCDVRPSADAHKVNQERDGLFFKVRHRMGPMVFGFIHVFIFFLVGLFH